MGRPAPPNVPHLACSPVAASQRTFMSHSWERSSLQVASCYMCARWPTECTQLLVGHRLSMPPIFGLGLRLPLGCPAPPRVSYDAFSPMAICKLLQVGLLANRMHPDAGWPPPSRTRSPQRSRVALPERGVWKIARERRPSLQLSPGGDQQVQL